VAVLPMSGTKALRNVVLVALFLCLVWQLLKARPSSNWPVPILLLVVYLCIFPVFAESPKTAVASLLEQWGRGLIAMLVGASVAAIF